MNKKTRQKVQVKTIENTSNLGQITKEEILSEHEKYDKNNYDPIKNLSEKEILIPSNKSEVVTIRLSPQENKLVSDLADENGLTKSAFIRMVVKKAVKKLKNK